jgi:hypothetical protein
VPHDALYLSGRLVGISLVDQGAICLEHEVGVLQGVRETRASAAHRLCCTRTVPR